MTPATSWHSQLCCLLQTAFPGPEEVVRAFPTLAGSAAFGACVASPSLGLHVFRIGDDGNGVTEPVAHAIRTAAFLAKQLPGTSFCWTLGGTSDEVPGSSRLEWPCSPGELRAQLLRRSRPSIDRLGQLERLGAWRRARSLMHQPLGSFDVLDRVVAGHPAARDDRPLVNELLTLRRWLARQTLDARQEAASGCSLSSPITLVRGTAGCGKSTVLAQLAARWLCNEPRQADGRTLLMGTTRGAANLLARRVRGIHRRFTGSARLPAGTRALAVGDLSLAIADPDAPNQRSPVAAVFIDEAQDLTDVDLRSLLDLTRAGQPDGARLVIAYDQLQRIRPDAAGSLAALLDQSGLAMERIDLRSCYRTPGQVFECALRARFLKVPGSGASGDTEARLWLAEALRDGTVRMGPHGAFHASCCTRGIGIEGRPEGAPPRLVTAIRGRTLLAEVVGCAESFRESGAGWDDIVVAVADTATRESLRAQATRARVRASWRPGPRGERATTGIAIRTVEELRGEDWPIVIVPILDEITPDPSMQARLYVAATRAQHSLTFVAAEGTPAWSLAKAICG